MKALIIEKCVDCPFAVDWSSGGAECKRHRPARKIDHGYSRDVSQNTVPSWCPLSDVEYSITLAQS